MMFKNRKEDTDYCHSLFLNVHYTAISLPGPYCWLLHRLFGVTEGCAVLAGIYICCEWASTSFGSTYCRVSWDVF